MANRLTATLPDLEAKAASLKDQQGPLHPRLISGPTGQDYDEALMLAKQDVSGTHTLRSGMRILICQPGDEEYPQGAVTFIWDEPRA